MRNRADCVGVCAFAGDRLGPSQLDFVFLDRQLFEGWQKILSPANLAQGLNRGCGFLVHGDTHLKAIPRALADAFADYLFFLDQFLQVGFDGIPIGAGQPTDVLNGDAAMFPRGDEDVL